MLKQLTEVSAFERATLVGPSRQLHGHYWSQFVYEPTKRGRRSAPYKYISPHKKYTRPAIPKRSPKVGLPDPIVPKQLERKAARRSMNALLENSLDFLLASEEFGILADLAMLFLPPLWDYLNPNADPYDMAAHGWTLCCDNGPPYTAYRWNTGSITPCGSAPVLCGLPLQVPSGTVVPGNALDVSSGNSFQEYFCLGPLNGAGTRMTLSQVWWIGGAHSLPPYKIPWQDPTKKQWSPALDPFPQPLPVPWVPRFSPILGPGGFPPPMPFHQIQPNFDGGSGDGYGGHGPVGPLGSGPRPGPVLPVPQGPPHVVRPPVPGEKEKKRRVGFSPFVKLVRRRVSDLTEILEKVEDVYNGLPNRIRREDWIRNGKKALSPQQQLRSLYDHMHDLDVGKVVKNLIKDEVSDRVIGKFSRMAGRIHSSPYYRSPLGVQAGNRFWPTHFPAPQLMG